MGVGDAHSPSGAIHRRYLVNNLVESRLSLGRSFERKREHADAMTCNYVIKSSGLDRRRAVAKQVLDTDLESAAAIEHGDSR